MRSWRLAQATALLATALTPAALAQTSPETGPGKPQPGQEPSFEAPVPEKGPLDFLNFLPEPWSFFPIPIIYTDPNRGPGYGLMPVFIRKPERRVEWLIAPSVDYNQVVGLEGVSRVYYYPKPGEEVVAYNSVATTANMEQSIQYRALDRVVAGTNTFTRGYFIVDTTHLFYGFGPGTKLAQLTNYKLREYGVDTDLGYMLGENVRLGGTLRYRNAKLSRGNLKDALQTLEVLPGLPGVSDRTGVDILAYGVHATLDLRDDKAIPNDGLLVDGSGELAARGGLSATRFERWTGEVVHHFPIIRPGTWVNVLRARYTGVDADRNLPFWELPTLGGEVNLRGFGAGRFTDEQYLTFSVEERIRFAHLLIMDYELVFEIAPFLDVGRVFGRDAHLTTRDWQLIPGIGGRLLLPDSKIVARLDVGESFHEGPAAFILLGYPF